MFHWPDLVQLPWLWKTLVVLQRVLQRVPWMVAAWTLPEKASGHCLPGWALMVTDCPEHDGVLLETVRLVSHAEYPRTHYLNLP